MESDSSSIRRLSDLATRLRPYALISDLRLEIFARVLAFGTIAHVLEFIMEQARVGPLTEYMERWSRIIPSVGWSSRTGLALQMATVAVSLAIFFLPYTRELLCLLGATFLLSQLASPERIASHCSMMTGGFLVILFLAIAEWIDLARRGRAGTAVSSQWYRWTLIGLRWVCALTYFFAFFYKLNPNWFSIEGKAPGFLIRPLEPFLNVIGIADSAHRVLAPIAIYGTLAIELFLPMLLYFRRTRLPGFLIGVIFSLGMVGQGVADFPILIVAFYATFLSLPEARALAERFAIRPTVSRTMVTALFASVWFIQRESRANWMYSHHDGPQVVALYSAADLLAFVFLIYVAIVLAQWLWESGMRDDAPIEAAAPPPRWSASAGLSAAIVFLVLAGFIYNNLAGFFALPYAGPMYMFSGINADMSNHFLLSRNSLGGSFDYVAVAKFESSDRREPTREFRSLARWLRFQSHPIELNLNEVRYHMSRICNEAPKPSVKLSVVTRAGEHLDYDDVCATPALLWYVPLPIASACAPRCNGELARRIRREVRRPSPDAPVESNPE